MNVKNVVKVMNFHSLLRVEKARREAEKYFSVEKELRRLIDVVTNNRNFVLDKQAMRVNKEAPVLNIYVGSDLGFCAAYNSNVNECARVDLDSYKIIIGKKVHKTMTNILMEMTKEAYLDDHSSLKEFLTESVKNQSYSQINILYNHYVNAGHIEWRRKRVFPLEATSQEAGEQYKNDYMEDFVCECDVTQLLVDMVITYVDIEIELTIKNSLASENIMRQNATSESLKKIDELEDDRRKFLRKEETKKSSEKITETYTKQKYLEEDD